MVWCRWSVAAWILPGGNARRATSHLNRVLAIVVFWLQDIAVTTVDNAGDDSGLCQLQLVSSALFHGRAKT